MSNLTVKGNASGTGTVILEAPNTNSNRTITLPDAATTLVGTDATQTLTNKTIQGGALTLGTAVASTSGTAIDFTGIPSWAKRVTVMLNGVSTNGTSLLMMQLGTSSGFLTSGYSGVAQASTQATANSTGIALNAVSSSAGITSGQIVLSKQNGNDWVAAGAAGDAGLTRCYAIGYYAPLAATLDRIRITTANGTDTFDAGTINIMWEG
jgi:hypothetical protein